MIGTCNCSAKIDAGKNLGKVSVVYKSTMTKLAKKDAYALNSCEITL